MFLQFSAHALSAPTPPMAPHGPQSKIHTLSCDPGGPARSSSDFPAFSRHTMQPFSVLLVINNTQPVLASGPLHMLLPSQVKLSPFQMLILAPYTIPPPPPGLTQVLLSLESPPRSLQIWLGHPITFLGPCLFQLQGPPSTGNKLKFSITTPPSFSSHISHLQKRRLRCWEEAWNRSMTGQ